MTKAYTVYAYAVADVILLLVCASLCGAWTPSPDEDDEVAPEAQPVPLAAD